MVDRINRRESTKLNEILLHLEVMLAALKQMPDINNMQSTDFH
jgi:hypothetical protein